jgi:hypothetical protein
MIKTKFVKRGIGALLVMSMALMMSCGSASSSSSSSSDDTTVDYTGSATITSSVSVSESSLAEIESTVSGRLITPTDKRFSVPLLDGIDSSRTIDGAEACLFELKSDGTEITTNICVDIVDGDAVFTGVKDGVMYVIKVVKEGDNGATIEMEAIANVPEGTTTITSDVNEKTYAIRQYIESSLAVATEAASISLDAATYSFIVELATQIVTELIKSGEIDLDPVIKSDDDRTRLEEQSELAGAAIESDDSIQDAQTDAQTIAFLNSDNLALNDAKKVINNIFIEYMGNSIEGFFVDEFGKQYVAGKEITVSEFAAGFNIALNPDLPTVVIDYLTTEQIQEIIIDGIETGEISDIYEHHAGTLPSNESVATISTLIFPDDESEKWAAGSVTGETVMNVPQTLTALLTNQSLMGNALETDPDTPDAVKSALAGMDSSDGGDMFFDPVTMIIGIGFVELEAGSFNFTELRYSVVSFTDYSQGQNPEKQLGLELKINVLYPSDKTVTKVEIAYTDTNSVAQVKEVPADEDSGGGSGSGDFKEAQFRLDPWDYSNALTGFSAGDAVVNVYATVDGTETIVKSETITLEIFEIGDVRFITPQSNQSLGSTGGEVSDFVIRWEEPTGNFDTSKYRLRYGMWFGLRAERINHDNPFGTVADPTNETSYSDQSGWDRVDSDNGEVFSYEERIYDSWGEFDGEIPTDNEGNEIEIDEKRHLAGDFLNLAKRNITLYDTIVDNANNYRTQYSIGIEAILIDEFGREVFRGGHDHVNFDVGTAADWTKDIAVDITFKVAPDTLLEGNGVVDVSGNVLSGTWKVGIVKERTWDNTNDEDIDEMRKSGSYTISPVTANGVEIVADITGVVGADDEQNISVTLPTITRATNPFVQDSGYTLVVWYDQDAASDSVSGWTTYGDPVSGKIDGQDYFIMEFHDRWGGFWRDHNGDIMYHDWENGSYPVSLSYEDSPEVSIEVGKYMEHLEDDDSN